MGRPKAWRKASAAHARAAKQAKSHTQASFPEEDNEIDVPAALATPETLDLTGVLSETEETEWMGGVDHVPDSENDDSDYSWADTDSVASISDDGGSESEADTSDLERLERSVRHELQLLAEPSPYEILMKQRGKADWEKAEHNRGFGYTGNSARTKRRREKGARDKAVKDAELRKTNGADMMRRFVVKKPRIIRAETQPAASSPSPVPPIQPPNLDTQNLVAEASVVAPVSTDPYIFSGYLSDIDDDEIQHVPEDDEGFHSRAPVQQSEDIVQSDLPEEISERTFHINPPPPLKRRRLEVSYLTTRLLAREKRREDLRKGLIDIERILAMKSTDFHAGREGLQARRTRAIQSYLHMVVRNKRLGKDAAGRAAESQKFSPNWGARLVSRWVRQWLEHRTLPRSRIGRHIKSFSLLEDPVIRAELRSYLRSDKWAMNPAKLVEFSKQKMIPQAAKEYLTNIIDHEMPRGLQKYIELELFPRIEQKVSKGISLQTAREFLRKEGFRYMSHQKALYYDGHERPDVVAYRQNDFIPLFESKRHLIVEFDPTDVTKEVVKPINHGERRLVLCPQDEMTAQANDGRTKSWVPAQEQPLRKKGVGRGLHRSDVLCACHGHMAAAGQSLEYGKNYEGYWTGELFVKQLREKIIPSFEELHGPEYQALFLIDNSQGHCAYSEDALLVSRMNLRPGGKQARMRDGWFFRGGQKVVQPMIFPPDHAEFPNQQKGIKQVLLERGLWENSLGMRCKKCADDATRCCGKRILELQPDFKAQKSLVQEVIEEAGHQCLILPKFHCELNFIEYFWGAVKRYLRDHCDYTFQTLQENMPRALASVDKLLIRKWQNRTMRWITAYRDGLDAKDAQIYVRSFSSKKYTSHRRVPEAVAQSMD